MTRPAGAGADSALLTDLYQLTMLQAHLEEGMQEDATFELFVRRLPPGRRFLVAAGLEPALRFLETLAFGEPEIGWLRERGDFAPPLPEPLRALDATPSLYPVAISAGLRALARAVDAATA